MTSKEIVDAVISYVRDENAKYAILIDGTWGSGKTYLYENYLVDAIDSVEVGKNERKQNVYISLYGISSIDSLAKQLITNYLIYVKGNGNKLVKKGLKPLAGIIGIASSAFSFSIGPISTDLSNVFEKIEGSIDVKDMVICFDDLERCTIPINEFFGFVNNLIEHCNCKVIILADEKNIGKIYANTNIEEKYLTVISGNRKVVEYIGDGKNIKTKNKGLGKDTNGEITVEEVKKLNEMLYSENYLYKDIKEKVIGKTMLYYPALKDVIKEVICGNEKSKGIIQEGQYNTDVPYSKPDAPGLAAEEVSRLLEVKKKGQNAIAELKKMAEAFAVRFKLEKCMSMSWLDGSNTKTRRYLWAPLKYGKYADNPVSVSVFVEKRNSDTCYRVSLEIKNDGDDKDIMKQYHSHLDIPLNVAAGLVYVSVSGSNEWGTPDILNKTQDEIKQEVESGKLKKVQICKYIDRKPDETNAYYHTEITKAIAAILPYYDHVLGIEKIEYYPSLAEYDPGITAEEYERILGDENIVKSAWLDTLHYLYLMGGIGTCKQIANKYGNGAAHYNTNAINVAKAVHKETNCPLCARDTGENQYWPVLFYGRDLADSADGVFSYKMRETLMEAIKALEERGVFQEMKEANKEFDKNLILYGPPGTGKTYNSATYAVAICDGKSVDELTDYDAVMTRYNELKKAGRIAFTTFHQSYGYEEFIEGIKPIIDENKQDIGYTIESGVFKEFCEKAKSIVRTKNGDSIDAGARIWKLTIMNGDLNQVKQECFEENNVRMGFDIDSDEARSFVEDVRLGDIILSFKTRKTIDGIAIVTDEAAVLQDKSMYKTARAVKWLAKNIDEDITDINNGKLLHRMTFAKVPNMNVKDVIKLAEKVNPGLESTVIEENTEPHVFIIDEINRGNISKIFGELITLIESTKRAGMSESASAILPYSGDEFSVPSNVYILGTMNTADRSIALMDTALRRRFQFIEMMPDSDVLRKIHADKVEDLDVAAMLDKINERITFLYDREHTIGHAFFTGLKDDASLSKLQSIFEKSVIPLLQEYFYEDYQKIQLVLGDNAKSDDNLKFILDEKVVAKNIFKGNVEDVIDLPEKRYSINKVAFGNINSYKEIL